MSSTKKIAILGGGISGLSCASQLLSRHKQSSSSYELEVTVFDTGRLRPGGRCSSRLVGDKPPVVKGQSQQQQQPKRRACDDAALNSIESNPNDGDGSNMTPKNIYKALLANTNQGNNDSMARVLNSCGPIDHAAQIISVPNVDNMDQFQKQIDDWVQSGVLECFPEGSICELLNDGDENTNQQLKLEELKGDMWYGKGGMGNIPLVMRDYCLSFNGFGDNYTGQSFRIAQDVWVSPSNGVKYIGNRNNDENNNSNNNSERDEFKWELRAGNKSLGKYHNLVIAHNGKCADRIMSRTPAKSFHSLLRTKFAPYVPQWGGREMTLNSIYSLVFAIKSSGDGVSPIAKVVSKLGNTQDGTDVYTVMIKNEPTLRLLSCNTLKHHHGQNPNSQSNIEIYTLLSSPKFGKQFKGPQENLPLDLQEKVVLKMLSNLENSLKLEQGDVSDLVVDLKLQLWGAAVPMNTWSSSSINKNDMDGFVYDATYQVGAAGDWILDPSIAGAWESGRRLADWILQHHDDVSEKKKNDWSVGLPDLTNNSNDREKNGKFVPSRVALESGIGTISPSPNSKFEFPSNDERQRRQGGRGGRGRGGRGRGRGGRGGRQGGGRNSNRARRSNGRTTTSQTVS